MSSAAPLPGQLGEFFEQMRAHLRGRCSVPDLVAALGPSTSNEECIGFYRVLIERNHQRFIQGLFGPVQTLADREAPGAWADICAEYEQMHNPKHWHPSGYTSGLPEFLAERRGRHPEQPAIWEEMVDFLECRRACYTCPNDVGDGFDRRLFIRQYTYPVQTLADALRTAPDIEIPEPAAKVIFVFRHEESGQQRVFNPTAASLAALARRQGLGKLPEMFAALPPALVDEAEAGLVKHGVLTKISPDP